MKEKQHKHLDISPKIEIKASMMSNKLSNNQIRMNQNNKIRSNSIIKLNR